MQNTNAFWVYNASAGSGKTYILVKEFLKVILQNPIETYQNILAMTFTNKAATEMKQRILTSLKEFSSRRDSDLLEDLHSQMGWEKEKIYEKSQKVLKHLLEHYSNFNITTIDAFTHKIIRTFAKDLGIPMQFEVVLEADELLEQAVQRLISKIGEDSYITKILIQFSREKSLEDKSWDIVYSLNEIAQILLKEEDGPYLEKISNYDFQNFAEILKKVRDKTDDIEKIFKEKAREGLELIRSIGVENKDFYRGYLPQFFDKVATGFENYEFKWESPSAKKVCDGILYSNSKPQEIKDKIDGIADSLISIYKEIKMLYEEKYSFYFLAKMIEKHWVPLAVLKQIEQEFTALKQEKEVQLIAEFNKILSKKIRNEPTPFIYERLGEWITCFFLDEMQDTSVLQWENLKPLIHNALSSQQDKLGLLLVGDAKQSIYRWRGGDPEQFIKLTSDENPFYVPKKVESLPKNYRSYNEIVTFNNAFFTHIAGEFEKEEHKKLYFDGSDQRFREDKKGGYVCLEFLEQAEKDEDVFLKKIADKIKSIEHVGYQKGDICILVRKNNQGVAIADYLSKQGIPITSSETLLVKKSREVQFLVAILHIFQNPLDKQMQFVALEYIYARYSKKILDAHHFYKTNLKNTAQDFINTLREFTQEPLPKNFWNLPFYEKMEALVNSFALITTSDAYVESFLEWVLEFSQKNKGSLSDFLEYWKQIKDKKSIIAPQNKDAVSIMTIHKCKGLEFPVVIFAYDLNITRFLKPTFWCEEIPKEYEGLQSFRLPLSQKNKLIGKQSEQRYNDYIQALEFDNINLLYVALTRAEHQLHIIMPKKIDKKGNENSKYFSGKFISYLKHKSLWDNTQSIYEFGQNVYIEPKESQEKIQIFSREKYISVPWKEHDMKLFPSIKKASQNNKRSSGILWHKILSKIYTAQDIENIIEDFALQNRINSGQKKRFKNLVEKVVYHSKLKDCFLTQKQVYTEREIIDEQGNILIPDRLVFQKNKVCIVDYKTGEPSLEHIEQVNKYAQVLQQMDYIVDTKFLVYLDADKQAVEIEQI